MICLVEESRLPIIYFVAFQIVVVFVLLNIVVALMLEIYSKVQAETKAEFNRRAYVIKLQR